MNSSNDQIKPPCCKQNEAKYDDDATLETVWGGCDNSYCQCEICLCGEGCQCTPSALVPATITALANSVEEETVQFGASIRGMTCHNCVKSVTRAIMLSSHGIRNVNINLSKGYGLIEYSPMLLHGNVKDAIQLIHDAIEDAGYEAEMDLSSVPESVVAEAVVEKTNDQLNVTSSIRCVEKEDARALGETVACDQIQECGICLDPIQRPVTLPCGHAFSSECLEVWRSKYDVRQVTEKTCPLCRSQMPPTKEMISQLESWRRAKDKIEADGDISSTDYLLAKAKVEELEANIGNSKDVLNYGDEYIELPDYIAKAAMENDIRTVLNWIGPPPVKMCMCSGNCEEVYKQRLNAKDPILMQITLLHAAAVNGHLDLTSILLQRGAYVDPVDANGYTPLKVKSLMGSADNDKTVRLLLEWGASLSSVPYNRDQFIRESFRHGHFKLGNLLKSELGGRRCEIVNMESSTDLNGMTCIAEKYLPEKDRYKVVFEHTNKVFLASPRNLKRQDRTPSDCGYYITYNDGKTARHNFGSREECRAFIKSLADVKDVKLASEIVAAAETRAEQAAGELLAELSLEESAADKISKKYRKKRKKTGRRRRKGVGN